MIMLNDGSSISSRKRVPYKHYFFHILRKYGSSQHERNEYKEHIFVNDNSADGSNIIYLRPGRLGNCKFHPPSFLWGVNDVCNYFGYYLLWGVTKC